MYCSKCGSLINDGDVFCGKCGAAVSGGCAGIPRTAETPMFNTASGNTHSSEWLTMLLLCMFLGMLGIHNFYAKNNGRGVIELVCTVAGFFLIIPLFVSAVFWIIDLCKIIGGSYKFADGTTLCH